MKRILVFLPILLMLSSVLPVMANSWDKIFRGLGYELMCLEMDDGKILKFTTYHKNKIDRTDFFHFIRDEGYRVSQIKVCIHNHPVRHGQDEFSRNDRKFYQQLCRYGFEGDFLLYCGGKIYNIKEKSK